MKVFNKHKKPHVPQPVIETKDAKLEKIKQQEERLKPICVELMNRTDLPIQEAEKLVYKLYDEAYQQLLREFGKPDMTQKEFCELYYKERK